MRDFRYLSEVTTLNLDEETCIGCGQCSLVCPHGVFSVRNGKARFADRDACIECGACALNCPVGAVQVCAGVGCAAFFINKWIKRSAKGDCCDGCC